MKALMDLFRIISITILGLIMNRRKLPKRSWRSEFVLRLAKRLLEESTTQSFSWLRNRQRLLKMYSPAMLRTSRKNINIAGVPCVVYTPKNNESPNTDIVYFHGGGYVIGSADGNSLTFAKLALASNARVIGVDYRLAPEHKIPAAQEDAMTVTRDIVDSSLLSGNSIVLAGDSAGGALAVTTALGFDKQNLRTKISACVLISPWVAPFDNDGLAAEHEQHDLWDCSIARNWSAQINSGNPDHEPLVDFRKVNLASLPPTYIQVAGREILLNQVDEFTTRLRQQGVNCKYDVFDDQFHVFQTFAPLVKEADIAIRMIGEYVMELNSASVNIDDTEEKHLGTNLS